MPRLDWLLSDEYDIDSLENRDEAMIASALPMADWVRRYHRAQVRGVERVPHGAALYVGNHNAGLWTPDSWIVGAALFRHHGIDAVPYGLGHENAIRIKGLHAFLVKVGAVRASHQNALRIFAAGHKALVYPGGDEDSCRPFSRRHDIVFGGRRGYVRLALRAGVPVVPVVTCGAHSSFVVLTDGKWLARLFGATDWFRLKVWPITLCAPWGVTVGPPPPFIPFPSRILIEILDPIHFERSGPEAADDEALVERCAAHVESLMQACLTRLRDERRRLRAGGSPRPV